MIWRKQTMGFGFKYSVDFNFNNAGIWKSLPNGDKVWQLVIERKCTYGEFVLKNYFYSGASLHLYDEKTNKVGAYTARNNRSDGELGTELVHGDKIIVEYYEP